MYPQAEDGPEKYGNTSVPHNPFLDISNQDHQNGSGISPYPRGPPMTDMTNIHSGNMIPMDGAPIRRVGELCVEDEKELVQLLFEMIVNEKDLEDSKMRVAE